MNEIYLDRVYDIPGFSLSNCRSILDIGANVGIFALYATSVAPQARVYCFEPVSSNFATLNFNLTANKAVRVQAYQLAVGAHCGTGHMKTNGLSVTHELSTTGTGTEVIEIVDLRRIFELTGVDSFDFVKMDVEGAELGILSECTDEELCRMRAISLEWHHSRRELEPVLQRLTRLGFQATPEFVGKRPRYLKARLVRERVELSGSQRVLTTGDKPSQP